MLRHVFLWNVKPDDPGAGDRSGYESWERLQAY